MNALPDAHSSKTECGLVARDAIDEATIRTSSCGRRLPLRSVRPYHSRSAQKRGNTFLNNANDAFAASALDYLLRSNSFHSACGRAGNFS